MLHTFGAHLESERVTEHIQYLSFLSSPHVCVRVFRLFARACVSCQPLLSMSKYGFLAFKVSNHVPKTLFFVYRWEFIFKNSVHGHRGHRAFSTVFCGMYTNCASANIRESSRHAISYRLYAILCYTCLYDSIMLSTRLGKYDTIFYSLFKLNAINCPDVRWK